MAFVPFTESDQPTMAAFNEKFQNAIDEAVLLGHKVVTGSYTGKGTYGSENKNTVSIPYTPLFFLIQREYRSMTGSHFVSFFSTGTYFTTGSTITGRLTVSSFGKAVSWYSSQSETEQMNVSGDKYNYLAICEGGEHNG